MAVAVQESARRVGELLNGRSLALHRPSQGGGVAALREHFCLRILKRIARFEQRCDLALLCAHELVDSPRRDGGLAQLGHRVGLIAVPASAQLSCQGIPPGGELLQRQAVEIVRLHCCEGYGRSIGRAAVVSAVMEIRHERADDSEAVADVHRAAFGDHGAVTAALVGDLRRLSPVSLVADRAGEVVGHVMFSLGWVDALARLVEVQILSPVGVKPEAQGQGIATALIRRGLELASAGGIPAVFLEGDPRFYGRFGFVPAESRGFRKPSVRIPDAGFQVVTLAAYEPWMTGRLVYPDAFWRQDSVGLREPVQSAPRAG